MKLTLFLCVLVGSFLLVSSLPSQWLRIYWKVNALIAGHTDVLHILDGSQYVTPAGFNKAKRAAKSLTKSVNKLAEIGPAQSRIGLIQYSEPAMTSLEMYLGEFNSKSNILDEIGPPGGVIYHDGSSVSLGKGMRLARKEFDDNDIGNNKIAWLVSDGRYDDNFDPVAEAEIMKNNGVTVVVIRIRSTYMNAPRPALYRLRRIASPGCHFRFRTYNDYKTTMKSIWEAVKNNN